MDEHQLGRAVTLFLDSAVPANTDVLDRVITRAEARRPQRRFPRGAFLVAAAAAAILATLGTVFAATGNFPINLNLVPFAPHSGLPIEKQSQDVASSNVPAKTPPTSTTLAVAEESFGHHVLTPSSSTGALTQGVYFQAAQPVPAGSKPGQQPTPATVRIRYSYAGATLTLWETFDPSSAPLTVDAVDQGGAKSKTSSGLGPIAIETVGGSQYAVVRTSAGGPVEVLMWKTSDGIVLTVQFDSPTPANVAFAFATSLS